ncbi:zebrafish testis-expressed 38 isoform X2 [Dunckerocampus dactyliophorus]|uniref:zebrafish testis-expressed 38 isoform X2 n=1 Tax=Dunckerocampus dactyliophorus TaxID=161453 RepID=UPI002406C42A|nr:zebrafish testis-expressed 38 isoform X2 [Dunckerocampus dactyliophorus]
MAGGKMCIKKSKEETTEWTALFPSNLKKKQESVVFVKRMMAVAVSSITYLRGIFPEDAYRARYLEDLCIKILREDCSTPGASKVVKWLIGCFDALEKQYLQVVFIGVYTNSDEPNCIVESYNFKFKYTDKGPEMDILRNNGKEVHVPMENTKAASVLLIRKLFLLMQNLNDLPSNIHLTMKLYYYDDITPADYEPPGFKEGECDSLWFQGTAVHFTVGEVQTTFHTFQVRVSAQQGRLGKLQEGNHVKETDQRTLPESDINKAGGKGLCKIAPAFDDLPSEDESAQFKQPTKPLVKTNATIKNKPRKRRRIL